METPAAAEQRSLDYYKSTADDDAAILEARAEAQREEKARKKEERKFKKMFGNWNPHQEYKLRYPTNLGAYSAIGAYQEKVDDFIGLIRIAKRQAARNKKETSVPRRPSPPSESHTSDATTNLLFAPPSSDTPVTRPSVPPEASTDIAESADEAYQRRLRLLEQREAQEPEIVPEAALEAAQEDTENQPSKPTATFFAPPPSLGGESLAPNAPTPSQAPPPTIANKPRVDIAEQIRKAKEIAAAAAANRVAPPPPPPPPSVETFKPKEPTPPPPPALAYSATIAAPPVHYSATISAPPVHYARPAPEEKVESEIQERPAKKQKTKEPKKPTKAELMMAKMGYVKGQGLGKNSDGVTTHLEVKARKDQGPRQAFDEFGDSTSGSIKSAQVFDITGGLRAQGTDHGPFGEPSRVIVAWGCIDGVDLAADAERDDGGIRQEMGDMFNRKVSSSLLDLFPCAYELGCSSATSCGFMWTCQALHGLYISSSKTLYAH